jgi:hypothetical protein
LDADRKSRGCATRGHRDVDGSNWSVVIAGDVADPIGDVAERRSHGKAHRDRLVPEDNAQERFTRQRPLM